MVDAMMSFKQVPARKRCATETCKRLFLGIYHIRQSAAHPMSPAEAQMHTSAYMTLQVFSTPETPTAVHANPRLSCSNTRATTPSGALGRVRQHQRIGGSMRQEINSGVFSPLLLEKEQSMQEKRRRELASGQNDYRRGFDDSNSRAENVLKKASRGSAIMDW